MIFNLDNMDQKFNLHQKMYQDSFMCNVKEYMVKLSPTIV